MSGTPEDRATFVRENCEALLADRDAKIERQTRRLAQLERSVEGFKKERRRAAHKIADLDRQLRQAWEAASHNPDPEIMTTSMGEVPPNLENSIGSDEGDGSGPEAAVTPPSALLTEDEHEAIRLLGQTATRFLGEMPRDHPADADEFIAIIHQAQHFIMANAAARGFPHLYRRSGSTKFETPT